MRNKRLYPVAWAGLAWACKERAGWQCEHCQVAQGETRISRRGHPYIIYLQAAHKYHSERSQADAELLCLCVSCHARYDYQHDQRIAAIRLHTLKHRRLITPRRIARARARVSGGCLPRFDILPLVRACAAFPRASLRYAHV